MASATYCLTFGDKEFADLATKFGRKASEVKSILMDACAHMDRVD